MPDIITLLEALSGEKMLPDIEFDIIFFLDLNFRYTFCNRAFLNIMNGSNVSNVLGGSAKNLFDRKNADLMQEKFNYALKYKKPISFVMTFNESSMCKFAKMTMFPVIQKGYAKGVLAVFSDITKEEQLKQSLYNQISQLNMLVENIPMQVYLKDKNLNYISGSKFSTSPIDINESAEIINLEDSYVIHNKKPLIREKAIKDIKGTEHYYKVYKTPVLDETGNINGIVSLTQNIDAEKQADNQKELFVATLIHDLKNPLTAQITNLKLLYNGTFGKINESQKQILDMIIDSADFMHEMLYSVLSVYKYDSGCAKLKKSKFKIIELINKCVKEFVNFAVQKNLKFNCSYGDENIEIYADKSQIRRVLANLIANAVQYSLSGTQIDISCKNINSKLYISIKNKSNPISENLKKHIFDKFTSEKNTGKKGIGLGLYYSRKIVEAHNGKISLITEGIDNDFLIELPLNYYTGKEEITKVKLV